MTLTEAVDILRRHNIWRKTDEVEMLNPTDVGDAIDIVCAISPLLLTVAQDCAGFSISDVLAKHGNQAGTAKEWVALKRRARVAVNAAGEQE